MLEVFTSLRWNAKGVASVCVAREWRCRKFAIPERREIHARVCGEQPRVATRPVGLDNFSAIPLAGECRGRHTSTTNSPVGIKFVVDTGKTVAVHMEGSKSNLANVQGPASGGESAYGLLAVYAQIDALIDRVE